MNRIDLLAIGETDPVMMESLRAALEAEFGVRCQILEASLDPAPSFHPERGQYSSTDILDRMQKQFGSGVDRLLGVTALDLYVPILTFVFGEAQLNGTCAVVSTHRLRQEFYGLPADAGLLEVRLLKEAVHELGHTLGLTHCEDYRCAMAASHEVEAIDLKGRSLCHECRARALALMTRKPAVKR
ncbi:MAG TPA: archaemetzincin family Zn-dependent metalloprotease [Terriglobia bacterium]|nr:archaemetzincin family Zn-dependent metalloprotease [Terriglobia bacterium]